MDKVSLAAALTAMTAISCLSLPARAQDAHAGQRYSMQPVEGGVVRMDNATGAMSLCHVRDDKLTCAMANDERGRLEAKIDRLTDRVARLEARVGGGDTQTEPLPSDKDLDRAMSTFERLVRRFFGMVDDLNRDFHEQPKQEDGSSPGPQKT